MLHENRNLYDIGERKPGEGERVHQKLHAHSRLVLDPAKFHRTGPIGRHLTGQKCKAIRNDQIAIARARLQTGEIAELRCSPCHGVIPG